MSRDMQPAQEDADEILVDAWNQWAYKKYKTQGECRIAIGLWSGGLSTLEWIEDYLRRRGRLDEHGNTLWLGRGESEPQ